MLSESLHISFESAVRKCLLDSLQPLLIDAVPEFGFSRYAHCIRAAVLTMPEYIDIRLRCLPCSVDIYTGGSTHICQVGLRNQRNDIVNLRSRLADSFRDLHNMISIDLGYQHRIDLNRHSRCRQFADTAKLIAYQNFSSLFPLVFFPVINNIPIQLRLYLWIYRINGDCQRRPIKRNVSNA